jgi:hypothetical protein
VPQFILGSAKKHHPYLRVFILANAFAFITVLYGYLRNVKPGQCALTQALCTFGDKEVDKEQAKNVHSSKTKKGHEQAIFLRR